MIQEEIRNAIQADDYGQLSHALKDWLSGLILTEEYLAECDLNGCNDPIETGAEIIKKGAK